MEITRGDSLKWTLSTHQGKPCLKSETHMIINRGKPGGDDYELFVQGYRGMKDLENGYITNTFKGTMDKCKGEAG